MAEVKQTVRLPAPVADVWRRIGGFNALPDWHPMVEKSELAEGGTVWKLTIPGGGVIVEKLEGKDDQSRTYSYSMTDSPLPVADFHASVHVHQEGDEAVVEWESRFEPKGASLDDASKTIQGLFEAGMDNLKKMFGDMSGTR
jgi:carbon monoxide dehydrogenase subunit G